MATEAVALNPTAIELPSTLVVSGNTLTQQALRLKVADAESYALAADIGRELKREKNARIDFFKPIKQGIDASKKVVLDREKEAVAPLDEAMKHLDAQATAWRKEEERQAAERRRAAEAAERQRIQAERDKEAAEAVAEGNKKLAEQIKAAPIETHIALEPTIPQVSGVRRRQVWKFRITATTAVPREWCIPDEKAIGDFVREHKENANGKIPGVEVYVEEHTI